MNLRFLFLVGALLLCGAIPGVTQDTGKAGFIDSVMRVLRLPRTTTEARQKGVPDSTIAGIIEVLRRDKVPAADAQQVVEDELEATDKGQPVDNFGAFVQSRHRAGLRGRELADAIHAEHAKRGIGQGKDKARQGDEDRDKAKAGRPGDDRGKPGDRAQEKGREPHGKSMRPDSAKRESPPNKRGGQPDSAGTGRRRPSGGTP